MAPPTRDPGRGPHGTEAFSPAVLSAMRGEDVETVETMVFQGHAAHRGRADPELIASTTVLPNVSTNAVSNGAPDATVVLDSAPTPSPGPGSVTREHGGTTFLPPDPQTAMLAEQRPGPAVPGPAPMVAPVVRPRAAPTPARRVPVLWLLVGMALLAAVVGSLVGLTIGVSSTH